jgi:hypothetical protein
MIDDSDDEGEIPLGYERTASGDIVPTLEANLVARWRSRSIVNLANRPELWPIAAEAYAKFGRPSAAAAAVGVTTVTIRNLWKSNEDFAALMTEAHETYAAKVQDEIRRRAIDGVDKPVFYKGEVAGYVKEYSDTLLVLEARRAHPEYREILATPRQGQTTVNVNTTSVAVASGSPAAAALDSLQSAQLTAEQRAALRALVTRAPLEVPATGTPAPAGEMLESGPVQAHSVGSGGVDPESAVRSAESGDGSTE